MYESPVFHYVNCNLICRETCVACDNIGVAGGLTVNFFLPRSVDEFSNLVNGKFAYFLDSQIYSFSEKYYKLLGIDKRVANSTP
jgi:hypothetical protein